MKSKLLEKHICGFNDGEQICKCYDKAIKDIVNIIEQIHIEYPDLESDIYGGGNLNFKTLLLEKIKEI